MRTLRAAAIVATLPAFLLSADLTGINPRESSNLYAAHGETADAIIAASLAPVKQAIAFFSSTVTAKYTVIEVAVFPKSGIAFEVNPLAFKLKGASGWKASPANPEEVATAWPKRLPSLPGNVLHATDPRLPGIATSRSGFHPGPDPNDLISNLRNLVMPKGPVDHPVAGYLYFPVSKERKKDSVELEYIPRDGKAIALPLTGQQN